MHAVTGVELEMRALIWAVAAGMLMVACAPPFGLGEPSRPALEQGARNSLSATKSYEMTGTYVEGGSSWTVDLQVQRPGAEHVKVNGPVQLEAIVVGGQPYFRGQQFLESYLGSDAQSQSLVKAAGNAWWKGLAAQPPQLPELTDGAAFRAFFMGSAVATRTDHVMVDGVDTVEFTGQRADVYIAEASPNRLIRIHMNKGVVVDGIGEGDLHYANYDNDFHIVAPSDVIDFSNLSTLPPLYTVLSVDTSGCSSPCVVSAQLKNLGGPTGAKAPSTVTFTMKDTASNQVLGSCKATVSPDVGFNGIATVGCTIPNVSGQHNAAVVTATADNPGRA